MNINIWHGCGRLTRDPEMRTVGETAVVSFALAINHTWKDKAGQKKEEVAFVDCEAWGRTGEVIAQYSVKGAELYVEGRLKMETWDDKNGGGKRSQMKVVVDKMQLGSKREANGDGEPPIGREDAHRAPAPRPAAPAPRPVPTASFDDPPF